MTRPARGDEPVMRGELRDADIRASVRAQFRCNPDESAGLAEPAPLATYTLTLYGPDQPGPPGLWRQFIDPALIAEAEENLTDLLPDGYSVKIERWDA